MHKRHVVGGRQCREFRMVGHDHRHFDVQLARPLPEEDVVETVADLGHHDEHPGFLRREPEVKVHAVSRANGLECLPELLQTHAGLLCGRGKVNPQEEALGGGIAELRRVDDVEIMLGQEASHGVHDAGTVRARQGQDVAVHVEVESADVELNWLN